MKECSLTPIHVFPNMRRSYAGPESTGPLRPVEQRAAGFSSVTLIGLPRRSLSREGMHEEKKGAVEKTGLSEELKRLGRIP
jgi:hypothetical protein